MDAVTSEISLVDRRRWRALHIFAHMRFLEVTIIKNAHIFYYITNSAPLQHVAAKKARFPENLYMYIQIIADRGKMI